MSNKILKQAMRDANIPVSEGDVLAQEDFQKARDFLYFQGIDLHEHFERYEVMFSGETLVAANPDASIIVPPPAPSTDFGIQADSNPEQSSDNQAEGSAGDVTADQAAQDQAGQSADADQAAQDQAAGDDAEDESGDAGPADQGGEAGADEGTGEGSDEASEDNEGNEDNSEAGE